MKPSRANVTALLLCALFFLSGVVWISRIGLQYDEALFSAGIYPPFVHRDSVRIFKQEYPLMVMSYVGTLKSMIYRFGVFPFFEPSPGSVRIPALLLATLSVWLFYRLMLRVSGVYAALVACALLATDTMYLLTARWDWGPVVLHHLCLIAALLALVRYAQDRHLGWLALGFFVLGLGLWDKAIFIWSLAGLSAAVLAACPKYVLDLLRRPVHLLAAVVCFGLGALPLIIYNVRYPLLTFRSNTALSLDELAPKFGMLLNTLNGSGLFGYIARGPAESLPKSPATTMESLLVDFNSAFGVPVENGMLYLMAAALVLAPFARRNWRLLVFAVVFAAVTWFQMGITVGAGGSIHHSVLIWPAPHAFIAVVLATIVDQRRRIWKWAAGAATVLVCCSNLLLTSSYYRDMLLYGSTVIWTDATYPAFDAIARARPARVCVLDWGFYEQLRLLHKGRTELCVAWAPRSADEAVHARNVLRETGSLFISHTEGNEITPGNTQRYLEFAASEGYTQSDKQTFMDTHGRVVVQLFRVIPKSK